MHGLIILVFSILTASVSLLLMVFPQAVVAFICENASSRWLRFSAIFIRVFLGALLINYSYQLISYDLLLRVIGALLLIAGLFICVLSEKQFSGVLLWFTEHFAAYFRLLGVCLFLFALGLFWISQLGQT